MQLNVFKASAIVYWAHCLTFGYLTGTVQGLHHPSPFPYKL